MIIYGRVKRRYKRSKFFKSISNYRYGHSTDRSVRSSALQSMLRANIEPIIEDIMDYFQMQPSDREFLYMGRRFGDTMVIKKGLYYVLYYYFGLSYQSVALVFNMYCHASIMSGVDVVRGILDSRVYNNDSKYMYQDLIKYIENKYGEKDVARRNFYSLCINKNY